MAGMLPGVESARRRRCHQTSTPTIGAVVSSPSSRRSSFSLFFPTSSASSLTQQRSRGQHQVDEKLGQVARQAKERLDERLRAQRKSPPVRRNNDEVGEAINRNERSVVNIRQLKTEVYGSKKKGGKKGKGWGNKLGWKSGEQEECTICLDEFKVGDNLVNLGCAHRFHSKCLVPWVETNAHCPCCRMSISS
ncbi:uncharacterized protein LOC141606112 [Silene latifolia]|uniref:uncharacterized protein LOC141606112 n=1 Tax=Silene latifolia TaxID=37657 RepID=UPI003D774249